MAIVAALVGGGAGALVGRATKSADKTNTGSVGAAVPSTGTSQNAGSPGASSASGVPPIAGSVARVAQQLLPSVVSIIVTSGQTGDEGTGIVLSADGLILTNNHVVEAAATSGVIAVTTDEGRSVKATIVGRDPTSDLAVIKAQGVSQLTPATLGDESTLVVGQAVVAIGSPLGLSNSVTSGIVSSLNRPVCTQNCGGGSTTPTVLDAIQTDAAINPGNSGGPLVDMAGRVVGINSAIATLDQQQALPNQQAGNIGVGFAIPITEAKRIAGELESSGHANHAVLGVGVQDSTDAALQTPNGSLIVSISSGGPADHAGLRKGDVIVKFGDRTIVDADSLIAATHAARPGSTVTITYLRGGQTDHTSLTLGSAVSQ